MQKAPDQIIYDAVFQVSQQLGYDTYMYLPPHEVAYPFVFLGEVFLEDRHTKSGPFGDVQITAHVFHDYMKRSEVTSMMSQIKSNLYSLRKVGSIYVHFKRGNATIMIDDTTADTLLHGTLELDFTFNY